MKVAPRWSPLRSIALAALAVGTLSSIIGSAFGQTRPAPARSPAADWPPPTVYERQHTFLDLGRTFEPLVADPRWVRFGAFYNFYARDDWIENVGTVSIGETIAVYRRVTQDRALWEFGLQSALYAVLELDEGPNDLFNTDILFGLYTAWRRDRLSVLARTYHDSGHVGDEFLLKNIQPGERYNFLLDGVNVLVSYDATQQARVYGGAYWFFDTNQDIDTTVILQWGLELEAPFRVLNQSARPVAAFDVQHASGDGHDFAPDLSVRAGLRFDGSADAGRSVSVLGEFYSGRERNGRFWEDRVTYAGIGFQFQL